MASKPLPSLQTLSVYRHQQPRQVLDFLDFAPQLTFLGMTGGRVNGDVEFLTPPDIAPILRLAALRELRLSHSRFEGFEPLRAQPVLETLRLNDCIFPREWKMQHPTLATVRFRRGSPERVLTHAMPKLRQFKVTR